MKRIILSIAAIFSAAFLSAQEPIGILHGPYLQNVTENEATIVWVSNNTSVGWVELAPDDGTHFYGCERPKYFDTKNGIKSESRVHSVKLTGLEKGTRYRYRIFSQEVLLHQGWQVHYGNIAATNVYSKKPLEFLTMDASRPEVSFAMVNDIHGDNERLAKLLGQCDLSNTDMVLFVGDMASAFNSEEQVFGDFMDTAVNIFATELPMYYTRGNHETRGNIAYDFQDYFSTKSEHIYYMYRQGPVCFIALDCGEDKPDSDLEYSNINAYAEYRSEQAEWLRKIVQTDEFKSAPFKIVTCHMPPFGDWYGEIDINEKFMPILNEAGVDIMLCAHYHKYVRKNAGEAAKFPIIVNSNKALLRATVSDKKLSIRITDVDGALVDTFNIEK